jgi:hypothetical protein
MVGFDRCCQGRSGNTPSNLAGPGQHRTNCEERQYNRNFGMVLWCVYCFWNSQSSHPQTEREESVKLSALEASKSSDAGARHNQDDVRADRDKVNHATLQMGQTPQAPENDTCRPCLYFYELSAEGLFVAAGNQMYTSPKNPSNPLTSMSPIPATSDTLQHTTDSDLQDGLEPRPPSATSTLSTCTSSIPAPPLDDATQTRQDAPRTRQEAQANKQEALKAAALEKAEKSKGRKPPAPCKTKSRRKTHRRDRNFEQQAQGDSETSDDEPEARDDEPEASSVTFGQVDLTISKPGFLNRYTVLSVDSNALCQQENVGVSKDLIPLTGPVGCKVCVVSTCLLYIYYFCYRRHAATRR